MQVKQHDERPLLLPSCLAAPGRKKRRSGRKREEMGERIEGHTRQWGLCGHLSVTDKSRRRRVDRKQCRYLNVRVFVTKKGWNKETRGRDGVNWKTKSSRKYAELIKHPVSLYQPECTLRRV